MHFCDTAFRIALAGHVSTALTLMITAVGCGPQPERIVLSPGAAHVAVHAKLDILAVDGCTDDDFGITGDGQGKIPTAIYLDFPTCATSQVVEILDHTWTDDAPFSIDTVELLNGAARLEVTARQPGSTELTVTLRTASDKEHEATGRYVALEVDRVELQALCPNGSADEIGMLPTGSDIRFDFWLYHGTERLHGYGYYPFETGALTFVEGDGNQLVYRTPETVQDVEVTSRVDPGFAALYRVVDASAMEELELTSTPPTCSTQMTARVRAGGEPICHDTFERELTIETPTRCSFHASETQAEIRVTGPTEVEVFGLTPGTCVVTARLLGSSLSHTVSVELPECATWERLSIGSAGTGEPFEDVWASGPDDVYVVGGDYILRYDGTVAQSISTNSSTVVWGSGPNDVYVVGTGFVKRTTDHGETWLGVGLQSYWIRDLWGSGPQDVFAVGDDGRIVQSLGTGFEDMESSTASALNAIWGSDATDLFAVGDGGVILHYDGVSWAPMNSPTEATLLGVSGSDPSTVFAVGEAGTLLRYDGLEWSELPSGTTRTLRDVWVGASAGWAVGDAGTILVYEPPGWRWTVELYAFDLRGVWSADGATAFIVGRRGSLLTQY